MIGSMLHIPPVTYHWQLRHASVADLLLMKHRQKGMHRY
jgi:hypothetical protein